MTGEAAAPVIAIDAMGGDQGPAPVLAGLDRAVRRSAGTPGLDRARFQLFGPEAALRPLLARRPALADRVAIRAADRSVAMSEDPARAVRQYRGTSMGEALEAVRRGEAQVAVSAGNTGALLAMAVLILKKAPGVMRPAIAVNWPAARAECYNTVLDVGADLKADPVQLAQYAVMGAEYARISLGHDCPRVGLLNLGTEANKGPAALRGAAERIRTAADRSGRFAYAGFVEGKDIPGATVEVIVTDGFTGNVALKTAEGTAAFIRHALGQAFKNSWMSRIASLFAYTSIRRLQTRIDPRQVNGGVFLGLDGAVVKSHGGADAVGFAAAVRLAATLAASDFSGHVARELVRLSVGADSDPDRPSEARSDPLRTAGKGA
ncbi:MAG: phosphate acyltransferase PlsX [Paracoccaceae bacterium]